MLITAIIAVRNEEHYLANCLRHVIDNGLKFAIVDHGSIDGTADIYNRAEFSGDCVEVRKLPYDGSFSLFDQMRAKQDLARAIESDWIVHLDADEIMHSYVPHESLHDAIARLNALQWNVINFDEFVFLPLAEDYLPDQVGYQPIGTYYFFEPSRPRLMRAWRKSANLSSLDSGGHILHGDAIRLAPESFALRHYIVRNQDHALSKYTSRVFSEDDLSRNWHHNRVNQPRDRFLFPGREELQHLVDPQSRVMDKRKPRCEHYWQRDGAWD